MSRLERIVAACGGVLLDGGARALIPGPDHSHKDRSVSLAETEEGRILIHCFSPGDDWRNVRRALAQKGLLDDEPSASEQRTRRSTPRIATQPADEERIARAQRIWNESHPVRSTQAAAYLRRRAISEAFWDSPALRFHPRMTSLDDRTRRPSLIAAITDDAGALQGVQVTLLTAHGADKAALPTPRRVIGRLIGGAVRLGEPKEELLVAEGVESALSASSALGVPSWAALSAHNLSQFTPPPRIARLIVAPDNDAAGRRAWHELRSRLTCHAALDLAMPPDGANDWNDWARTARS